MTDKLNILLDAIGSMPIRTAIEHPTMREVMMAYLDYCGDASAAEPDADEWIPWNGGDRPVCPDTMVSVRLRNGEEGKPRAAGEYGWARSRFLVGPEDWDIIAYRIIGEAS